MERRRRCRARRIDASDYAELHRIAKSYMRRERDGHTLQTSALVNEAYVRLIDWKTAKWENRAHFFGVSAQLMRRILVDFARSRPKIKDGEVRHVRSTKRLPSRRKKTRIWSRWTKR
jgi:hypothetical protein